MADIEYVKSGKVADIAEPFATILVKVGAARFIDRQMKAEVVESAEISPNTGKPKRQYRRRDMKAED